MPVGRRGSFTSLALAPVFGPRGAAFCCALWCDAATRAMRTVYCPCRNHERSRRSRRPLWRVARWTHPFARDTLKEKEFTNLSEPGGGGGEGWWFSRVEQRARVCPGTHCEKHLITGSCPCGHDPHGRVHRHTALNIQPGLSPSSWQESA